MHAECIWCFDHINVTAVRTYHIITLVFVVFFVFSVLLLFSCIVYFYWSLSRCMHWHAFNTDWHWHTAVCSMYNIHTLRSVRLFLSLSLSLIAFLFSIAKKTVSIETTYNTVNVHSDLDKVKLVCFIAYNNTKYRHLLHYIANSLIECVKNEKSGSERVLAK